MNEFKGLTYLQRKVRVLPEVKYFLAFLFPEEASTSSLSLEVLKHDGINIFIAIPQVMIKLFLRRGK